MVSGPLYAGVFLSWLIMSIVLTGVGVIVALELLLGLGLGLELELGSGLGFWPAKSASVLASMSVVEG